VTAKAAADAAEEDAPGSEIEAFGRKAEASGAEAYRSCNSVRPKAIRGFVA
jgi:hypothetical protein